ncbi:hypothetical protein [Photobacterium kishitanii]|uniref:Uncharacterized protein n=1 Tax=Photobacterium kishitanii TaxID=318456 RepID=A0A2T3KA15_9GAMM|nr:hypothetical protein [Photobacterium kishitanii]PSU87814.1 hypothetical protein C9J27_25985 [Photobacterium kishitanii]
MEIYEIIINNAIENILSAKLSVIFEIESSQAGHVDFDYIENSVLGVLRNSLSMNSDGENATVGNYMFVEVAAFYSIHKLLLSRKDLIGFECSSPRIFSQAFEYVSQGCVPEMIFCTDQRYELTEMEKRLYEMVSNSLSSMSMIDLFGEQGGDMMDSLRSALSKINSKYNGSPAVKARDLLERVSNSKLSSSEAEFTKNALVLRCLCCVSEVLGSEISFLYSQVRKYVESTIIKTLNTSQSFKTYCLMVVVANVYNMTDIEDEILALIKFNYGKLDYFVFDQVKKNLDKENAFTQVICRSFATNLDGMPLKERILVALWGSDAKS